MKPEKETGFTITNFFYFFYKKKARFDSVVVAD